MNNRLFIQLFVLFLTISLLGGANPAIGADKVVYLFPQLDGTVQVRVRHTRSEINAMPSVLLSCPEGSTALWTGTLFNYDAQVESDSDWVQYGILDSFFSIENSPPPTTGAWHFTNLPQAKWEYVDIILACIEPNFFPGDSRPILRKTQVSLNSGGTTNGIAACAQDETALGGSAYFVDGTGRIAASYPSHNLNTDPFQQNYGEGRPMGWKSTGICQANSCNFEVNAVCGKTTRYANTYPLKDGAGKKSEPFEIKSEKLTIAPNGTYILNMSCSPSRSAVAAGYFTSDPANVILRSLEPIALGTPYASRSPGTHDAPLGYKATFKNKGTASAQVGIAVTCVDSPSGRANVTEFLNSTLNHYFVTGSSVEADGILAGAAGPGWSLTGQGFAAYLPGIGPGNDVCRFYNFGANTHFYTANAGECAWVRTDPGWTYEGLAFRIQVPENGSCPVGTVPVYRVYNNRYMVNDSNHRFTTSLQIYNEMVASGWKGEGTVMCAINTN